MIKTQKKINVTELRIGNLLWDTEDNEVFEVVALRKRMGELDDTIAGIELTEEWLIKFGFKNFSPGLYHIKIHAEQERFLETMLPSKKFWDLTITITKKHDDDIELWIRAIHYVHELQNLFFSLTGRELELTK